MREATMREIDAAGLKEWLHDGEEIALLDVREHGEYGEAHLFYAVSLPFSRLEAGIGRLVPRRSCRVVLYDDGTSGVAEKAAGRLASYGYENVSVLAGGTPAWSAVGLRLFAGVHVPSKTFGELVEHALPIPRIAAPELRELIEAGENVVVVDGRPGDEYRKMNIPGSICCPNGELVYRIDQIVSNPDATIVINCAGRTRSIMGTAILHGFGIRNRVLALENGTMGWRLAGFELEHGADRLDPAAPEGSRLERLKEEAGRFARRHGVRRVAADVAARWVRDAGRTTFLLDIRTEEEFRAGSIAGAVSAPGGQLLQATDLWLGVRHARVVLIDDDEVRATVVASWLVRMGWDAQVLEGGLAAAGDRLAAPGSGVVAAKLPTFQLLDAVELANLPANAVVVDVRSAMDYRAGHLDRAIWATRARLEKAVRDIDGRPVAVVADNGTVARAFAADLAAAGVAVAGLHLGSPADWSRAGLALAVTPGLPPDEECIDYLFFVHDRHAGNLEAARQYLAWETGLVDLLDERERAAFPIVAAAVS
jgi:rhodanese-related sulfurtransferase